MKDAGLCVRTAAWGLAVSFATLLQSPFLGTAQAASGARVAYELANGLKVVLAPRADDTDAYVLVKYDAGQIHAPKDYKGLPHLAEHLTYRGSRHLKPLEYAKHLDRVGAGYNGITRAESTLYFIAVPPNALKLALWLESDRMAFALDGVTEEALEAEKKTVANEWQEKNSLDSMIWRSKAAALYGKDGPGAADANEVANVNSVSLSGARWFIQSTHRPDNATLVLGGNFDADEARNLGRALEVLEGNDPDGTKSVIEGLTSEDIQREAKRIGKQLTTFAKPLKSSRAAFFEMDSEDPCR